jgi:hypothetical protein
MKGWVKIHRSFLTWEWFDKPEMVQLFVYLLLKANHDAKEWHGIVIERGQIVTSVARIAAETRLSAQVVRTCINRLKSTNEITSTATNKYTIITICKYDTYQETDNEPNEDNNEQISNQLTNEQQTNNNQLTTNKNVKNIRTIRSDSIYTHTEFSYLLKSLASARASTPEQVQEIADIVQEIVNRVSTDSEAARVYGSLPIYDKAYVWNWAQHPKLMEMFSESLSYPIFLSLVKRYELEDIKRVIAAMANKIPEVGERRGSFETTFEQWAAQDFQIQEKKRLGNPRYN